MRKWAFLPRWLLEQCVARYPVAARGEVDVEVSPKVLEEYMGSSFFIPAVLVFDNRGDKIALLSGDDPRVFRNLLRPSWAASGRRWEGCD